MKIDLQEIQPGWEVYEPGGQRVGDVVGLESGTVHVRTGGVFSKDLYIPPTAIAELEPHRVELNVPKDDLNGRGWESAPAPDMTAPMNEVVTGEPLAAVPDVSTEGWTWLCQYCGSELVVSRTGDPAKMTTDSRYVCRCGTAMDAAPETADREVSHASSR